MVVHTVGWIPHSVEVQTTGSSAYLGSFQILDNSGSETLDWIMREASLLCQTVRYCRFSIASKILVVTTSLVSRLRFKAEQDVLSHAEVQEVDSIFSTALVATTNNMHGYPKKLLYLSRARGGLAMPLFSDRAAEGKQQKLFGCMRSQQLHAQAAKGAMSRLARKHGYYAIAGHALVIHPLPPQRHDRKLFCDGPAEWLAMHGMHICRRGMPATEAGLSGLLLHLVPTADAALRQVCRSQQMYTVGDLVEYRRGEVHWYAHGPLADLLPYLPAVDPSEQQPLRVGQCWKLANRHGDMKPDDVIRINGGCDDMAVIAWYRVALGGKKRGLVHYTGQRFTVPPSPTAALNLRRDR